MNDLKPIDKFRNELESHAEMILKAAPSHIDAARFNEMAARCVIANPDLLQCTKRSLFVSIAEAASLGLTLDSVLGYAYLIPFKNRGVLEAQLVPGYKGVRELAYRSEKVAAFHWGIVRPGDEFSYEYGTEQFLRHIPKGDPVTEWTHAWSLAETVYGGKMFAVMTEGEVKQHRNKFAKGWQRAGSAWLTNPEAMALKTVALKVMRLLPLSPDVQRLVERATFEKPTESDDLPDGSETPPEDLEELTEQLDPAGAQCDEEGNVVEQSAIPF